jgi:hypothetical protein
VYITEIHTIPDSHDDGRFSAVQYAKDKLNYQNNQNTAGPSTKKSKVSNNIKKETKQSNQTQQKVIIIYNMTRLQHLQSGLISPGKRTREERGISFDKLPSHYSCPPL